MKEAMPSLGGGKKPGGLAIVIGEGSDESDERDAFDSFADSAGIPEDKRDDAYDSLVAMIQACIAREKSGDYDEEG